MKTFTKSHYKKFLLGGAMTLAMGAMPLVAHATPYAFASNIITGLAITNADGTAYTTFSGLDQVNGSAIYNGVGKTTSNQGDVNGALALPFQPAVVTAGTAPTGYTSSSPGTFTGTRANASIGALGSSGVSVNNVAEGYGNATLGGTSTANNASTIKFSVTGTGQELRLAFNDAVSLIASTANVSGENANSTLTDSFSLFDGSGKLLASFSPFGNSFGGTSTGTSFSTAHVGSQSGSPSPASYSGNGSFVFTTDFSLATGSTYTISLASGSTENIAPGTSTPVPEPGSLLLLGTGLLGLAFVSRKRIKKS